MSVDDANGRALSLTRMQRILLEGARRWEERTGRSWSALEVLREERLLGAFRSKSTFGATLDLIQALLNQGLAMRAEPADCGWWLTDAGHAAAGDAVFEMLPEQVGP